MRLFQGCVEGREIALTRKGVNPHTAVLIRKSATTATSTAQTSPENTEMKTEDLAKAVNVLLSFDDVTKAHYVGLTEEAQVAFLNKSATERKTEADAAKAASDKTALEAEAAKSGKSAKELELEKSLEKANAAIADLQKSRVEDDIAKRASTEFGAFPGGAEKVIPLLKSFAKMPEADRLAAEAVLKAQCDFAKQAGSNVGITVDDLAKAHPATAELKAKAIEIAKATGVSEQVAEGAILADPLNAALFDRVRVEQQAA